MTDCYLTWFAVSGITLQINLIFRNPPICDVSFCSNRMRGHNAGSRCVDNAHGEPTDGEVQPVARGVPAEMLQHEVGWQRAELQRR